jgi:hypothetical protein
MWDVPVITDRTITNQSTNRRDIILDEKNEKTCQLIDIAITDDSNVNTQETKKLRKYKDLEIEFSRMWQVRTKIVLVIFGALGTIKKGLD